MHTEHLQNVTTGRVLAGWLVAAAITSLAAFALISTGLLTEESTAANTWWSVVAVLIGFFGGGFFAGFRAIEAPILHAAGIGLTSLIVWFVLNALAAIFFRAWEWPSLTAEMTVSLLLAQLVAAVVGALLGYNIALRGEPGLSEHEPIEG
jgi:ABC-type transporter Mla maintaining outer membrane lipid asymmetry permease subunit MlaE